MEKVKKRGPRRVRVGGLLIPKENMPARNALVNLFHSEYYPKKKKPPTVAVICVLLLQGMTYEDAATLAPTFGYRE
jgi:hypothetical protein